MMTKHYRELTGDDPKLLEYLEKHKTLTYPENLRIVARGEEDTKDGKAYRFEKYGLNFFKSNYFDWVKILISPRQTISRKDHYGS